jgi:Icc protein
MNKIKLYIPMKKLACLTGLWLLLISGCNPPAIDTQEAGDEDFTFAFLTDIHLMPELDAEAGFQKAIDTVNRLDPDFVITGGDLVKDALNQTYGRSDSLFKLYIKMSEGFRMPVYNTIGNHDIYGWEREEEGIEKHPEYGKTMYEQRIGERYYSFDYKSWHFMLLDGMCHRESGSYYGKIDDEQIRWIREDLEKTGKETPIIVSTHIPFLTVQTQLEKGALASTPAHLAIENSREVLLLFWEYNLKLVLQGHLHFLEDINVNDQVHFITGGAVSGQWWNTDPDYPVQEGFLLVHVRDGDFSWENVDLDWTPPGYR